MKISILAEGDAETRDSWSGIPRSVISHLRQRGHQVEAHDVDLLGVRRIVAAALSISPSRERWRARYRLGALGFRMRSSRARSALTRAPAGDFILQMGATFEPAGRGSVPYAVYCDSNIVVSERHVDSGWSYAGVMSDRARATLRELEGRVYGQAALVFTMSEKLRGSFIDDYGLDPARVRTVYGGPNFDDDESRDAARAEARGNGTPTVLFVGRRFERKGGPVLLEAFRGVRRELPTARLIVVGPDTAPAILEPGVEWLGFLDKRDPADRERLSDAFASADVFCLPTLWEPFGVAFLEAMHYGLPCIGSDVWAVPEMIRPGENGLVVPRWDAARLTEAILALLRDPERARRMGENGRRLARREFTWDAVVDRMLDAMHSHQSETGRGAKP